METKIIKNSPADSLKGLVKEQSSVELAKARYYIPGGVNSPATSLESINSTPFFIKKAKGSKITDIDRNEYTDFCLSWGTHILGHAPDSVLDDVEGALWDGTSYGMPSPLETTLAEAIVEAVPSIEQVRLANSGTEAVMSAIRLAWAFTGKNKIIKFEGNYHGHADQLPISLSSSESASLDIVSSLGIPTEFTQHTISVPFNDKEAVFEAFAKYKDEIAAVIVEPVPTNMGVVIPREGFLQFLRNITTEFQSLLIFDEVTTGFRPKLGGAQDYFKIIPDITILGKIIGAGFPLGAYGGRREIMSLVAPEGNINQTDTLGNPIAVTAGIATLRRLRNPLFYETLNHRSRDFIHYLEEVTKNRGVVINSFKSMFTIFFSEHPINNYNDVKKSDTRRFEKFFKKSLEKGIFFSPSQFETNFISIAHLPEDLNKTIESTYQILKTI